MSEENKFGPKKSWTRIFRKRWFFPSVYLMLAALLISAVVWYQNSGEEEVVVEDWEEQEESEDYTPVPNEDDETAEPVMADPEVLELPVANPDETEIVTKFFDYNADESDQVNALIHYNNRYYQSTGIDIAQGDGETFDVLASISGTVAEVKEDPLLGNVVVIDHGDDVKTFYASLGEVHVEVEDSVSQGDVIGTAGKSNFGKDNGTHVHFEVRKGDTAVNPEELVSQPLAVLDELVSADEAVEEETEENAETEESTDEVADEVTDEVAEEEDAEEEQDESEAEEDDDSLADDEEVEEDAEE